MRTEGEEKRTGLLKGTRGRMAVLFALQAAAFLLILFFCDVKYEVSDDFVMELLASGAWSGASDPHLMFCSYLWGLLLSFLYRLTDGISWYLLAELAVGLLALCAASCYLAYRTRLSFGILGTAIVTVFLARDLYVLPQFTKTAAAAIACGGFLCIWGLFHQKRGAVLFGGLVTVLGCFLRHNSLFSVGAFLALYVLFETVRLVCARGRDGQEELPDAQKKTERHGGGRGTGKQLIRIYGGGLCLLALIFGLRWCNNMAYQWDEDYRYFMDYSYVRAYLVDYPLPEYQECAKELEEIGISENDYELITSWSFADREVFSLERMRHVLAIVDQCRPRNYSSVKELLDRFLERGTLHYPGTQCAGLLAAFGLLGFACSRPGEKKREGRALIAQLCMTAVSGAVALLLLFWFIYVGHAVYRVESGILCAAAMLALYASRLPEPVSEGSPEGERGHAFLAGRGRSPWGRRLLKVLPCALAALLALCQIRDYAPDDSWQELTEEEYRDYVNSTFNYSWDYLPEKYTKCVNRRSVSGELLEEMQSHPENRYLLDFNTTIQTLYYGLSPFYSFEEGALSNCLYLGGVTVNHPAVEKTLAQWGQTEALPALLADDVYFVSNTTSAQVLTYLQEHYDAGASMELVKTVDGYEIWKYYGAVNSNV